MENLVRQIVITIVLSFVIIKIFLTLFRKKELRAIFDTIEADYESFNNLPEDELSIVIEAIEKTQKLEKIWILIIGSASASFPLLACVLTVYSYFTENPRKYMIHETIMPFIDDKKYSSPFFEIQAVYSLYIVWLVFVGYTGFDGIFSVCILHISLKIKLFSHKLMHLMDDTDVPSVKLRIASIVRDQCDVYSFIQQIQTSFEIWLAGIFLISVVQIGMALSQTTTKGDSEVNIIYYVFAVTTAVHIYLPCYLTSDVTFNMAEVANCIYACKWESTPDSGVRRAVAIMLARAQVPTHFKAYDMLTYNMKMFVSIMQTAYSMYTLLRS
ncbi:putative odorant receptor 92a [Zerene cesonia]|uniref:putative odorant receptor 92a n=1 Tax=Zerene cesonia TaxID=33412 RepID=UPI0018E4DE0E|nr:putative odorant receptor 92a [Zerene cesonia]